MFVQSRYMYDIMLMYIRYMFISMFNIFKT
jgi:hypothetical protein